jgi:molybdopterin-guanine dinucleotide biosynthesis protein A
MSERDRETDEGGAERGERAPLPRPLLGVVLAGGRSRRMGREKAFVHLHGRPLLGHVLARLAPQVDGLVINANGEPARFGAFGVPVIPDTQPGLGPLGGIAAALRHAAAGGWAAILTCPSDAPGLPRDLATRLGAAIGGAGAACAGGPDGLEPLFALWRVEALPAVEAALAEGRLAVRDALAVAGFRTESFPDGAAFANLNTPDELAALEARAGGPWP